VPPLFSDIWNGNSRDACRGRDAEQKDESAKPGVAGCPDSASTPSDSRQRFAYTAIISARE
jgi:hypothetical protein